MRGPDLDDAPFFLAFFLLSIAVLMFITRCM